MISDTEKTVQRIEQTLLGVIARQGLFLSGSRVIAACSGGADSMALLLFLLRNAERLQITVQAAHVNHGLRGAAADADAAFVAEFCNYLTQCLLVSLSGKAVFVSDYVANEINAARLDWENLIIRLQFKPPVLCKVLHYL